MANIKNIIRNLDEDENLIVSANIDGIQFNNIVNEDLGLSKTGIMSRKNTIWVGDDTTGTYILPAINVVDIDWNGAQLKNGSTVKATLNTTGEMLSVLQTAYNYATTYNVKYSGGKLYDDKNTEIKVGSNVTESTVSGWGFTKNAGTVTGVKINGSTYNPSNGVVDLGTVIRAHQDLSGKADKDHNHPMSQITGLSDALNKITTDIQLLSDRIAELKKHHESVLVTGISLSQTSATLTGKNATLTLTPTITPTDATNKSVTWTSSSASVATVSGGVVTPLKAGTTTITATSTDGSNKSASCRITVKDGTTTWILTPEEASIKEGNQKTFTMAVYSSDTFVTPNADNTTWFVQYKDPSDNSYVSANNILTTTTSNNVSSTAVVTAPMLMSNSSATYYINAYASNNGGCKTAVLHVSPYAVPVTSVSLDKTTYNLSGSTSGILTATVEPANATDKSVTWMVSGNAISYKANDNNTLTITGKAIGTATVIATAGGKSSTSCTVTVKQGTISINGINPSSAEIQEGDSKRFTVTYSSTLFAGTPHNFTWSCSANNSFLSSTSGTTITFNAPDEIGDGVSDSSVTYYISVSSTQASGNASASVIVRQKAEETKYYWYVGNENPMNTGMATNIDTSALTFTLNKSHNLLQTATGYTDLIGKEFAFPNHFVIPTEWLQKIKIVNMSNMPWAWSTTVIDNTNKYTWCWNSGTGTGTFKIVAK